MKVTLILGSTLFVFYFIYFLLMWNKSKCWKPTKNSSHNNYTPSVSIIVPTYNEEDTIVHKLKNLMKQDYPKMEIILIDGASEDGTVKFARKFINENTLAVKIIEEDERKGKASSLNVAFNYCSGEIVVVSDADVLWEKDAVSKVVRNFSKSNVGAVTGKQILLNPNQSFTTKFEKTYRSFFEILRQGESELDSTTIFNGPLMAFRSNLLEPISEDTIADDSMLAIKIRKKGFRTLYDPTTIFYEYTPPDLRSVFIQKLRRGQGLIQLFFRNLDVLFNPKYEMFGMIIFPAEFFIHVISPIMVIMFLFLLPYTTLLINKYILLFFSVPVIMSLCYCKIKEINVRNVLFCFLNSQFTLLFAIICQILKIPQHKWKKITEVRKLF